MLGPWANTIMDMIIIVAGERRFNRGRRENLDAVRIEEEKMHTEQQLLCQAPEVTLVLWIIKILATTRGQTGGKAISMPKDIGYLAGT